MKYCCERMLTEIEKNCDIHLSRFDCPDCLIDYNEIFDEYILIIHDGGQSGIEINYCPWCGAKLPESKRNEWFNRLNEMNIDPMDFNNLPVNYKSKKWREF